jgi:hypothetical protein
MKTAVEWLESEFVKLEHKIGVHNEMYKLIEQAKEMEKQQIIDAYEEGMDYDFKDNGEQYYKETFKKK